MLATVAGQHQADQASNTCSSTWILCWRVSSHATGQNESRQTAERNQAAGHVKARLQATGYPDCGPLGRKTIAKAGTKPEKKELRNGARWPKVCGSQRNQATQEKESRLQNRPTSSVIQKEGRSAPAQSRLRAAPAGLAPPALPPAPGPASLQLLGDELLVVEVAQPLLLHQGALSLQRVLVPPRRLRHAHAQLRLRALQQRAQRLEVL